MDSIRNPTCEASLRTYVDWCATQETDVAQAVAAAGAMTHLQQSVVALSAIRSGAIRRLWATGWSLADISAALDISRARIHQIIGK